MSNDSKKKFLKHLLEVSETVLEKDHPNPNRIGCPGHAVLEQLAHFSEEHITVEAEVIQHITECFPCFRELRAMRLKRKAKN